MRCGISYGNNYGISYSIIGNTDEWFIVNIHRTGHSVRTLKRIYPTHDDAVKAAKAYIERIK